MKLCFIFSIKYFPEKEPTSSNDILLAPAKLVFKLMQKLAVFIYLFLYFNKLKPNLLDSIILETLRFGLSVLALISLSMHSVLI